MHDIGVALITSGLASLPAIITVLVTSYIALVKFRAENAKMKSKLDELHVAVNGNTERLITSNQQLSSANRALSDKLPAPAPDAPP